jgi:Raf kinase inhibitor-like YbhB/YbcL family protein
MRWPSRYVSTALAVLVGVGATSLVAACDTGDGRELSPPVFPAPTSTIASTIGTGSPAEAGVTSLFIQPFALVLPWQDGAEIPALNTCDGDDVAPALSWTGVPDGAVEMALVVTDGDAGGFVHWVLTGFDPAIRSMLEGQVPLGAREWPNSFGEPGWNGPCPPAGSRHTYRFVLHALNQPLAVVDDIPVDDLLTNIVAFTLGSTTVTGTYTR